MNFESDTEALEVLEANGIEVTKEFDILYPRGKEFIEEVHAAIDYMLEEWDFGIKYI